MSRRARCALHTRPQPHRATTTSSPINANMIVIKSSVPSVAMSICYPTTKLRTPRLTRRALPTPRHMAAFATPSRRSCCAGCSVRPRDALGYPSLLFCFVVTLAYKSRVHHCSYPGDVLFGATRDDRRRLFALQAPVSSDHKYTYFSYSPFSLVGGGTTHVHTGRSRVAPEYPRILPLREQPDPLAR